MSMQSSPAPPHPPDGNLGTTDRLSWGADPEWIDYAKSDTDDRLASVPGISPIPICLILKVSADISPSLLTNGYAVWRIAILLRLR